MILTDKQVLEDPPEAYEFLHDGRWLVRLKGGRLVLVVLPPKDSAAFSRALDATNVPAARLWRVR